MDINANLNSLMEEAQKMQSRMEAAQKELTELKVEGQAGGGSVVVEMNGRHEVLNVYIDNKAQAQPKEMLEALIAAATNNAVKKVEEVSMKKIKELTEGLNMAADLLKDDSGDKE